MRAFTRLFSKELTRTQRIQSWQFIGPLSLVFTSSLLLIKGGFNTDLLLCMFFGSLLIWKEPKRGWIFALILLSISALLKHIQIQEDHLWQLGLEASVALGHLLTYFGLQESYFDVETFEEEKRKQGDKTYLLEEKFQEKARQLDSEKGLLEDRIDLLKKELAERQEKVSSLEELNDVLRHSLQDLEEKKDPALQVDRKKDHLITELQFEITDLQEELKALEDVAKIRANNQQLLHELNKHRVDAYQSKLMVEMLRQMLANLKKKVADDDIQEKLLQSQRVIESLEEKIRTTPQQAGEEKYKALQEEYQKNVSLLKQYEEKFQEFKSQENALKQLRKQFQEKGDVLHQTRKELFQTENELLGMQRDQEEWAIQGTSDLSDLMQDFQEVYQAYASLDEENSKLFEIISELFGTGNPSSNVPPAVEGKE